ncbi:uncharacterized protein LOC126908233 [Daktulosphaira vitifoliae]|uniref:uncharacterized protein LOC126908233 n=1 Tax=Daktulosphaira vitifoliae TaxID=58002 RepID=UPI0021AA609F|nr:uncharacterized protein LOC126908233 [Daktulosphaira vitifoliae]
MHSNNVTNTILLFEKLIKSAEKSNVTKKIITRTKKIEHNFDLNRPNQKDDQTIISSDAKAPNFTTPVINKNGELKKKKFKGISNKIAFFEKKATTIKNSSNTVIKNQRENLWGRLNKLNQIKEKLHVGGNGGQCVLGGRQYKHDQDITEEEYKNDIDVEETCKKLIPNN